MPMIEGLGDEVTVILGAFLLCIVLMLAWFSTHTSEIPLLREVGVIVVELSQRRRGEVQTSDGSERASPEGEDSIASSQGGRDVSEEEATDDNRDFSNEPREADSQLRRASEVLLAHQEKNKSPNTSRSAGDAACSSLPDVASQVIADFESLSLRERAEARLLKEDSDSDNALLEGAVGPVPPASVVADESGRLDDSELLDHPGEEEMRRRRVQYFQTPSQVTSSLTDERGGEDVPDLTSSSTDQCGGAGVPVGLNLFSPLSTASCDRSVGQLSVSNSKPHEASSVVGESPQTPTPDQGMRGQVPSDAGEGTSPSPSEEGPAAADHDGQSWIRVKLKYMNETQRLVYASPLDTIGDFRRTHFQEEIQENKWVRFIYNGQDLRDDARTLQMYNVGDNCTMHCLITAHTQSSPARDALAEEDADDSVLGALMYPLFTLVLMVVWYFRFTYRQYFSAMSTLCLIGISFLLALSYFSSMRAPDTPLHQAAEGAGGAQPQQNRPHQD